MNPKSKTGETRKQILDDHRQIGELLARVSAAAAPPERAACLEKLLPLLERHFREEEDEIDGLHAGIQRTAPQHVNALLQLKEEHKDLLQRVRALKDLVAAGGDPERQRAKGVQLKRELAAHESRETEIFIDSIWTDIGTGD